MSGNAMSSVASDGGVSDNTETFGHEPGLRSFSIKYTTTNVETITAYCGVTLKKGEMCRSPTFPADCEDHQFVVELTLAYKESSKVLFTLRLVKSVGIVKANVSVYFKLDNKLICKHEWKQGLLIDPLKVQMKLTRDIDGQNIECGIFIKRVKKCVAQKCTNMCLSDACRSFKDDLLKMFQQETFSDASITVGNHVFPVHQCILACRSPALYSLLQQDVQGTSSKCMIITEFDIHTVNHFLVYLYTGNVKFDSVNFAINLIQMADKYGVKDLKTACEIYLASSLTEGNASMILLNADNNSAAELKQKTLDFISKNPHILTDLKFGKITELAQKPGLLAETLKRILKQNE